MILTWQQRHREPGNKIEVSTKIPPILNVVLWPTSSRVRPINKQIWKSTIIETSQNRSPLKMFKKRRPAVHEISNPRGIVRRRWFSNSIPYLWCLLFKWYINNPGQGKQEGNWTWLDLWNLLTLNFKDKSFHNSNDWLGFIFKCVSHHGWAQFSDLHCSNYWEMYLWNFSSIFA